MWNSILLTIIGVAIPAFIGYGLKLLNAYLNIKAHSTGLQHAFQLAGETVQSAVDATTQTFVDTLKGTPGWNTDAMKQAFDQSVQKAKQLISADVQNIIQNETGNFDSWLTTKIEQTVKSRA